MMGGARKSRAVRSARQGASVRAEWILGSSPRMTKERWRGKREESDGQRRIVSIPRYGLHEWITPPAAPSSDRTESPSLPSVILGLDPRIHAAAASDIGHESTAQMDSSPPQKQNPHLAMRVLPFWRNCLSISRAGCRGRRTLPAGRAVPRCGSAGCTWRCGRNGRASRS